MFGIWMAFYFFSVFFMSTLHMDDYRYALHFAGDEHVYILWCFGYCVCVCVAYHTITHLLCFIQSIY